MHSVGIIDAGYLYAASAISVTRRPAREAIHLDAAAALDQLRSVTAFGGDTKFYLFDGAESRVATPAQQRWATAGVRLRMGGFEEGHQIGVDERIIRVCVGLVRCQRVRRIALLSGDSDLIPAVRECVSLGAQVEVLSIAGINQSKKLVRSATDFRLIDRASVERFARPVISFPRQNLMT
jgi:hypothetical protein